MNKHITRGLALAALTGGFTLLGATAANAIDIGGGDDDSLLGGILGGSSNSDLLGDLHLPVNAQAPVNVDGLAVDVLGSEDGIGSLGDGIFATTGSSNADILADLGIDTSSLLGDSDDLAAVVGVPLDASNTWLSVLGNEPNGIVVVPTLSGEPNASITDGVDGLIDGVVDAPVNVSCSSVTVVSDYSSDCDGAATPGTGSGSEGTDGDLLDLGGLLGDDGVSLDQPVTLDDEQVDVLDGALLDGVLEEDGVDVDFGDSVIDPSVGTDETTFLDEFVSAMVGAPIDLSNAWVSAFGENGGVVIVPDLTVGTSALTGGALMSEILAPVAIDCVTVTVLSDYERDCGTSTVDDTPTDPEEPVTPVTPTVPGDVDGTDNNGADDGDALDPCAVVPTSATTGLVADDASAVNAGMLAMAALVGGLTAMGLLAFGRKFSAQK